MMRWVLRTMGPGGGRPIQLQYVVSVAQSAPAGWRDPPGLLLAGGRRGPAAGGLAEAVPGPHAVLVGGERLQGSVWKAGGTSHGSSGRPERKGGGERRDG